MINGTEDYHSKKLKKIVKRSGKERPSDYFTNKVMKSVRLEAGLRQSQETSQLFSPVRLLIGFGLLVAILAVIYVGFTYGSYFLWELDPVFTPVLHDLYNGFKKMVSAIQISSVTVVIIGGSIFLIGLEYFYRRIGSPGNRYIF